MKVKNVRFAPQFRSFAGQMESPKTGPSGLERSTWLIGPSFRDSWSAGMRPKKSRSLMIEQTVKSAIACALASGQRGVGSPLGASFKDHVERSRRGATHDAEV